MEDVFASGDLPRAAETLANMRHCLSAVGEVVFFLWCFISYCGFFFFTNADGPSPFHVQVAEFANVRKQLEVLEDRLDAMVQPRLTDALSNRKVSSLSRSEFDNHCLPLFPIISSSLITIK